MKLKSMAYPAVLLAALVLWTGCKTTQDSVKVEANVKTAAQEAPAEKKTPEEDAASKRDSLERKLAIANLKMEHARMELANHEANTEASRKHAEEELVMSTAKLTVFMEQTKADRIAKRELDLQRSRDAAKEADEELKQLEIMYQEKDLDDLTREFVISRGKRRAEQRSRSLRIQENEFKTYRDHELMQEEKRLKLDMEKKGNDLKKMARSAEAALIQKKIAVLNVESEIEGLRDQLKKLEEKGK